MKNLFEYLAEQMNKSFDIPDIKNILMTGHVIKCNKDGKFEISETPFTGWMQKRKPFNRVQYRSVFIDAAAFDEAIEELQNEHLLKSDSQNGYQYYWVETKSAN